MKIKIIKSVVDAAEPLECKDLLIWDSVLSGFFVRVRPSGRKSFWAYYRLRDNRQQKIKIGDYPAMTCEAAREKFRDLSNQVFEGHNPLEEIRERARVEYAAERDATVQELYEKYMTDHAIFKKPSSRLNDIGYWRNYILPALASKRVRDVTTGDISGVHKKIGSQIGKRGDLMTTTANRVLEVMKKAFNLAEEWQWRDQGTNPCNRIKKFKERARRRYLTFDEARRLGSVIQSYVESDSYRKRQIARFILLLVYTGARKSEILSARWSWVDRSRGVLALPDTKSNEPQDIQLPDEALSLLDDIKADQSRQGKIGSLYIFDGRLASQPLKDEGNHWNEIRSEAGLSDFRLHDLRHSFASFMAMATGSELMIQRSLRHADAKTSQRYTHLFNDPLRAAVQETADRVRSALNGDVVDFATVRARGAV